MAAKTKASSRAPAPAALAKLRAESPSSAPLTLDERVQRIQAMHLRIDGYVRYMCQIATTNGASAEVKERAVTHFYEKLVSVEKQLAEIHDAYRLE